MAAALLAASAWLGCPSADDAGTRRVRTALLQSLPPLDGTTLQVTLLQVDYGPGAASAPHRHACPLVGYVVRGTLRSQFAGAPDTTYHAGDAFYEPPDNTHLVSANASAREPTTLLAYSLCDRGREP